MSMKSIYSILTALCTIASPCLAQPYLEKTANVILEFMDSFDSSALSDTVIVSVRDVDGKDWAGRFVKGHAAKLPYGKYEVVARNGDHGFYDVHATIEVSSQVVTARIGMIWAGLENDGPVEQLRGVIKAQSFSQSDTCRAAGLYNRIAYDARIDQASGSFNFGGVWPGMYSLACEVNGKWYSLGTAKINAVTPHLEFDLTKAETRDKAN